jgi:acyl-ACP thioesterase
MKLKNTNYLPWIFDLLSHVMKLKNTNYLPWIFVLLSHVMKLKNIYISLTDYNVFVHASSSRELISMNYC